MIARSKRHPERDCDGRKMVRQKNGEKARESIVSLLSFCHAIFLPKKRAMTTAPPVIRPVKFKR
jgi:hypothetical protein